MPFSSETSGPLVSIGVPVRNGEPYIAHALQLLVNQTYKNIEIIISDNNSNDETPSIIQHYANADKRIVVYRQNKTLTAAENFRFVMDKSHGEYFMWAACDDRRSLDHVENLLLAIKGQPNAVLAFSDVARFSNFESYEDASTIEHPFESKAFEDPILRLKRQIQLGCFHIYGLIRRDALTQYKWTEIDQGPDRVLLTYLSFLGDFIRADGGIFYYYVPLERKTPELRSQANSLRRLKYFPGIRFCISCAFMAHYAATLAGQKISRLQLFLVLWTTRILPRRKIYLYSATPYFIRKIYTKYIR